MNTQDIQSLAVKARDDGSRLFGVCELIYTISIIGVWIVGLVGLFATLFALTTAGFLVGIVTGISFFIICFIMYAGAVLSTHVAKVLVHTSFASVAIVEHLTRTDADNHAQAKAGQDTSPAPVQPEKQTDIVQPESVVNEANNLFKRLSVYGYEMKKYNSQSGKWVISNGNSEFEQSIAELRDLLRNFEK